VRIINAGSSTFFRFMIDGHPLTVVHADGSVVEPVEVHLHRPSSPGAGARWIALTPRAGGACLCRLLLLTCLAPDIVEARSRRSAG
jgi:hypothetical protein